MSIMNGGEGRKTNLSLVSRDTIIKCLVIYNWLTPSSQCITFLSVTNQSLIIMQGKFQSLQWNRSSLVLARELQAIMTYQEGIS